MKLRQGSGKDRKGSARIGKDGMDGQGSARMGKDGPQGKKPKSVDKSDRLEFMF